MCLVVREPGRVDDAAHLFEKRIGGGKRIPLSISIGAQPDINAVRPDEPHHVLDAADPMPSQGIQKHRLRTVERLEDSVRRNAHGAIVPRREALLRVARIGTSRTPTRDLCHTFGVVIEGTRAGRKRRRWTEWQIVLLGLVLLLALIVTMTVFGEAPNSSLPLRTSSSAVRP